MLRVKTKLSGFKISPHLVLRDGGVLLEEISCKYYDKKECKEQKEHHSYNIGTRNVRTLKQGNAEE